MSLTAAERDHIRLERSDRRRAAAIGPAGPTPTSPALADICFEQANGDCVLALDLACDLVDKYGPSYGIRARLRKRDAADVPSQVT